MRKWPIIVGALLLMIVAGAIAAKRIAARLPEYLRERVVSTLQQRFASEVEFADLQIYVYPRIVIRGANLALRLHGRTDVPPLITIQKCSAEIDLWELIRRTRRVQKITLEGLKVTMPPVEATPPANPIPAARRHEPAPFKVLVDEIVADNAELDMLVRDPDKFPHVFHIRHLRLQHAGTGQAMLYQAYLTNPVPEGEIESHGQFGPWQRDQPRLTPLAGSYNFRHADLATIQGLSGTLTSEGKFSGLLDRIDVKGVTVTPDFSLGISGHAVPLETEFHAIVDGSTGNTLLESVHAKLLNSEFDCRGGIFRVPGQLNRRVLLDASGDRARLQDLLRLAVKAQPPPMSGAVNFRTRIDIPPGAGVVADRLRLDGEFEISAARFSSLNVQSKVESLSQRGSGDSEEEGSGSVVSDFSGKFVLRNSRMTFSRMTFGVPGAFVHLEGTYALRGEDVDFHGTLRLHARLSQTTHGWKSVLLKPVDPLFAKDGAGTLLPIKVTGTGSDPHFGVELRHVF